ncbi:MAG: hypothetical protein HKN91_15335 [Acidimicrobiia bacterium]|nr:hypothetical protein [Acidimicrobiia bacterium]
MQDSRSAGVAAKADAGRTGKTTAAPIAKMATNRLVVLSPDTLVTLSSREIKGLEYRVLYTVLGRLQGVYADSASKSGQIWLETIELQRLQKLSTYLNLFAADRDFYPHKRL